MSFIYCSLGKKIHQISKKTRFLIKGDYLEKYLLLLKSKINQFWKKSFELEMTIFTKIIYCR